MADSDDDYDRDNSSSRRRGKFRKEREDLHRYNFNSQDDYKRRDRPSTGHQSHRRSPQRSYHNHRRTPSPKYSREGNSKRSVNERYHHQPPASYRGERSMSPSPRHRYSGSSRQDTGFKRSFSPGDPGTYSKSALPMDTFNGPQQFYGDFRSRSAFEEVNGSYPYVQDGSQKRMRKDWPLNTDMGPNYFEHDNRSEPIISNPDMFANYSHQTNWNSYNPSYRYYEHEPNFHNHFQESYPAFFNHQYNQGSYLPNNAPMNRPHLNSFNRFYSTNGPMNNGFGNNYNGQMSLNNGSFNNNNAMVNHTNNYNNRQFQIDTQPQMLSFKQFLSNLNSELDMGPGGSKMIALEVATKRYNDYKNEFRSGQIKDFFNAHKSEEWFKQRYQPEVSAKRRDEQRVAVKRRLGIFNDLLTRFGDGVSLDMRDSNAEKKLSKFLDACMIKLEEGTDEDLKILDTIYPVETTLPEVTVDKISDTESGVESNSDLEADELVDSKIDRRRNKNTSLKSKKTSEPKSPSVKDEKEFNGEVTEAEKSPKPEEIESKESEIHLAKESNFQAVTIPQKTQSIFFKHLPVNVTRQDLEEIGSKHEGFLRASISEPAPERRFQRRGWLTFSSKIDIKETCNKINGVKLHDMSLNASINREIDQKIKRIIGLTNHKEITRNDLRIIAKIVDNMDKRWGLWQYASLYRNSCPDIGSFKTDCEKKKIKNKTPVAEVLAENEDINVSVKKEEVKQLNEVDDMTENPLVLSANECLKQLRDPNDTPKPVDESTDDKDPGTCPEKMEITPSETDKKSDSKSTICRSVKLERDECVAKLLDKLILYLRIVHSIDYYNATEYQQEDWMPNRCGVLHVRGSADQNSSYTSNAIVNILNGVNINYFNPEAIKKVQIEEWIRLFELNVKSYYEYKDKIDIEVARRLGLKNVQEEIDNYIKANTQKIDKDIWLCPISAKKFKSAEYVKKHIETKHRHKLEEVWNETEYFNRFVYDPKRPYLPEHPFTKMMGNQSGQVGYNCHGNGNGNVIMGMRQMEHGGYAKNEYVRGHLGYQMAPGFQQNAFKHINHAKRFSKFNLLN